LIRKIFKYIGLAIGWFIQSRYLFRIYNYIFEYAPDCVVRLLVRYVKLPEKDNLWKIVLLNGKKVSTRIYANNIKTTQFALSYKWHSPPLNFTEKLLNHYYSSEIPWVDVGANLGIRSLLSLAEKRHVVFIEPNSELNKLNIERCKLNGFDNFELFEMGASNISGIKEFTIDKSSYNSTLEVNLVSEDSIDHKEFIKVDTLDNILQPFLESSITACIKIDVEGHELHVIEGARKLISKLSPTIIIEVNQKAYHLLNFIRIFHDLGYEIFEIGKFSRDVYYKKVVKDHSLNYSDILYNDFITMNDKALINIFEKYSLK
jgi:FkbM family methyltransferase